MGLKSLISNLEAGKPFGDTYPSTSTPTNIAGGFNYGESISIFDINLPSTKNDYFPFRQRSMGYGPQGIKDSTGMFGRLYGPAPYRKQQKLKMKIYGPNDYGPDLGGFFGAVDSVTDVGIRGGLTTALKRSVIDAARIGEFMLSAKGLGFIAKNVGLQMTNPKLQEGKGSSFLGMNLGSNNRIYNLGINTLAQTLTAATGLHVNRAGLLPIGAKNYEVEQGYRVDTNNKTKYEWNVRGSGPEEEGGTGNITNSIDVYKGNRLASLYNKVIRHQRGMDGDPLTELYEFRGGPHSVYGLGKTRLKRYVFTNIDSAKATAESIRQLEGYIYSRHLGDMHGPSGQGKLLDVIDFRKYRGLPYTNYNQKLGETGKSLHTLYGYPRGVVRPGTPTNDDGTINVRRPHPLRDKINSADIWRHTGPFDNTDVGKNNRDYIKFRIEAVDTDKPTYSNTMVFRALLDNMSDSYTSKWNSYEYNGRAEPLYTFGSFNRGVSFSFKAAAFSRDDMKPLYRKLNYLVSQTAGEYSNTRLRGNFCRLTIGDYFSRLPGFFTSIKLQWKSSYPWEIALYNDGVGSKASVIKPQTDTTGRDQWLDDMAQSRYNYKFWHGQKSEPENFNAPYEETPGPTGVMEYMDSDMNQLPTILDVSCQFQPIHDFIPQKSIQKSPFIIPTKYTKPGITEDQNWLSKGVISQEDIFAKQEARDIEDMNIENDYQLMLQKEEEEKERKRLEREAEEARAFQEAMDTHIEIEEEDDLDPWDLPPQDPDVDPNLLPPQGPPATGP